VLKSLDGMCNGRAVKSVRIVQLDPATVRALASGARPAASPVPLTDHLTDPEHRPLWRRRSRQIDEDPAAAAWVTGVVWDPEIGTAVGRAGFHGPPDEAGMVEVGYAIDPAYRRQGYARAALAVLLARAASEPAVTTVRASVRPDNTGSRALVAEFGFVAVGEQWDDEDGLETVYERPA
jgi:RimJ/RimL family protein N-acetyltransferase